MRPFSRRSEDAIALLATAILIAAAFADILFFGRSFYMRDVARFFAPNFAVLHDLIRSGFPFWNPHYNAGQPFASNPAYAALYPPQWVFTSLHVEVVAHYFLAAAGMLLFLRSLGLRTPASFFGAVSFALGGMMLSLSNVCTVLFGMAWLPWLGWAITRRRFPLAALFLGIILIIGDQAVILEAGILTAAWAVWLREWKPAALILIGGLLVGSAQIVPAIDHQFDSARATAIPAAIATQWTMPLVRPLELALPTAFGSFGDVPVYWATFYGKMSLPWVLSFYAGMLVFAFACAGFIRRVPGWGFAAVIVAIGYFTAVTPVLYRSGLRSVRYPEKFFMMADVALIVFASIVADRIFDDDKLRQTAAIVAGAVAIAALASLAFVPDPGRSGAVVTIVTAAILALLLATRRPPLVAFALFLFIDLGLRVRGLTPRVDASYYDPPPLAAQLRGGRVFNDAEWRLMFEPGRPAPVAEQLATQRDGLMPDMQALWGIDAALENDVTLTNLLPSIEFRGLFWQDRLRNGGGLVPMFMTMAGVTHVLEMHDTFRVVALPQNRRFYFADQIATGPIRGGVSPHVAFTDVPPFVPAAGNVLRAAETPGAIDLDVETTGNALLVISETRHKYWTGTLDGQPAALHPTNVAFQSVLVPPGRHHVALRYRNPLIVIFGFVSLVSAAALIVVSRWR